MRTQLFGIFLRSSYVKRAEPQNNRFIFLNVHFSHSFCLMPLKEQNTLNRTISDAVMGCNSNYSAQKCPQCDMMRGLNNQTE